jgi:eukaryotic-like serine/threonine-protein kinase
VVKGVVYIGSDNHKVYALPAVTGAKLWSFTTTSSVNSSPTIANGVVYIGSGDGGFYVLNAATGAKLWSFSTFPFSFVTSAAVVNGVVYIGSENGNMYALNAASGAELWSFTAAGSVITSPTAPTGRLLRLGERRQVRHHVRAKRRHRRQAVELHSVSHDWLVACGGQQSDLLRLRLRLLRAQRSHGAKRWGFNFVSVRSLPAVADGVVYFGSDNHDVYALSAATGAKLWSFKTKGPIGSSPAVANGVVYLGASDGDAYSFHLPVLITA